MCTKQTLEALFHCPVAHQNFSFLATAHDCVTGVSPFLFDYARFLKVFLRGRGGGETRDRLRRE